MLLIAGGLTALQQAAIIAAAPFVLIMLGTCVGLFKEMRAETRGAVAVQPRPAAPPRRARRRDAARRPRAP